ncbi:MAG: O-antigen ligase family protein [Gemmatimonadetes bacterium]|nr:O-antigen ligase family protein [Gemmatimonadota bacterium]
MSAMAHPAQPAGWLRGPVPKPAIKHRRWDALLACLAIYLFTAVGRVHDVFSPLGKAKLVLIVCILAILFFAADRSASRKLSPVLRARTTKWVLGLLCWAALTVPLALNRGLAFYSLIDTLLKTVVMYIVVVAAARDWKDVERLAFVYFSCVVVYAVVVLARFNLTEEQWRLESLYYYDANDFATLIVTALPMGLYFVFTPRPFLQRAFAAGGMCCLLVSFIWTGSRGGFLALLAVSAFLLLRYKAIHALWRFAAMGVIGILLVATASEAYWEKMNSLVHPETDYNLVGPWGRLQIWKRGIGYMVHHPLLGVGFSNFPTAEGTLFTLASEMQARGRGVKWSVAHNSYIHAGAELGVPGLILFLGILITSLRALRSVRQFPGGPRAPPKLAQALSASLLGFAVGAFFLSLTYSDMLFALAALAAALAKTTRIARVPARGVRR